MPDKLILSYDVGTTNLKTSLMDTKLKILGTELESYPVYFPKKGYAEQDPFDWWNTVVKTTNQLIKDKNVDVSKIAAIVFGGQALSTVLINKDGEPLMRSIIWMDTRAAPQAKKAMGGGLLKISGYNLFSLIRFLRITGGGPGLAGKDHIPRILWLKENMPDIYRDTHKFLDTNGFIIYKMTGESVMSKFDAHISWMMDTRPGKHYWSETILKKYGIDKEKLPEIKASTDIAGKLTKQAADELSLQEETPVVVGSGDVAATAVGSGAVAEKECFIYIGTSDFMGTHVRDRKVDISHYMGAVCSAIPDMYLYTGEQETAGTCLDWVKNEIYKDSAEELGGKIYDLLDEVAAKIPPGSEGLIFTPWLSGEKTPMDDDTIRGGFHNLSLEHTREHTVRAVMEGVAFNIRWAFRCMENKVGLAKWVNFVGGGAMGKTWGQIIADVLNREIRQVENPREAGVRGAAMIATVGLGMHKDFPSAAKLVKITRKFKPNPENIKLYDSLFVEFEKLYKGHKKICENLYRKISE
ncbi:MAG: FGGY-family carbohydrate kinase [Candidatus Lokiarchaeia archaeon]